LTKFVIVSIFRVRWVTVDVFNQARDSDTSNNEFNLQQGNLCAYQTDLVPDESSTVNDAKLAVAPCFLPKAFSGPYWIVAYDEVRGYALISGGQPDLQSYDSQQQFMGCTTGKGVNNSGLWIFSRSSDRDEELISDVRDIAFSMGFDVSVLNDVDQSAGLCGYDDGAGDSASLVPTGDPSAVPTFSPTSGGTGVLCEDSMESFSNWLWFGPDRDCDWVEDGAFFRCFFYAEYCPDSCGRCD
jgi:lipocalin